MKRNAIVRIILYSIAILVLLSILGVGIAAKYLTFDPEFSGEYTASSTAELDADTIRNLSIEWAAGTITIRPADVSRVTVTETCREDAEPMVWRQEGDTLKIKFFKNKNVYKLGSIDPKDLLIEVPMDWSCDELEVDTASADLTVESMTIRKVDFDGASGKFDFRNCTVETIDMDTASGDMKFCGSLNVLECDAASADCEIVLTNSPSRIDMDTASGDLDLTLPEDCGFTVDMEALSGDLQTDFEVDRTNAGFTAGDGTCRIDISALSGDVHIHKGTEARNCDH